MSAAFNEEKQGEEMQGSAKRLSPKANIIFSLIAAVSIIGGAAMASAGPAAFAAAIALWAFASVACGMIFSFGSAAARILPAGCGAVAVLFGAEGVILAVLAISCGVALAFAASSRMRRFETVMWMTVAVCIVFGCVFGAAVRESKGDISRESVEEYISDASQSVCDEYTSAMETTREALEILGSLTPEAEERLSVLASPDMASALAKSFIISIPAYFAAIVTVLCYGISSIFLLAADKTGNKLYFMRPFSVPLFMAHTFIICYFASIFLDAQTAVGLLVYYASVLFTPCFAYVGAKSLIAMIRSGAPKFIRVATVLICIVMLPLFTYLITLLAFIGAYVIVRAASLRRILKK